MNSTRASQVIGKIDTLLIPVGTLEAHGPHCSVATDTIIPEKLVEEVDKIAGDRVLVGPTIPYGHTWRLKDRPGSLDVPRRVLADYAFEVIKGYGETWKIKYVLFVNGHGGNIEALHDAAERSADLGMKSVVLSWWVGGFRDAYKGIVEETEGHGGEAETSLLLYAGEKYVDKSLIPNQDHDFSYKTAAGIGDIYDPASDRAAFPKAYSGKPRAASLEKGKLLNERAVKVILQVIDAMRSGAPLIA